MSCYYNYPKLRWDALTDRLLLAVQQLIIYDQHNIGGAQYSSRAF
jgi:hypothetical protein